jgi:anti-sigma regulatory factor (Ser/Thr protein kinase)
MSEAYSADIILTGFSDVDAEALHIAAGRLGRSTLTGDPVNDEGQAFVFAAAYDEQILRSHRASALEDPRLWCFCVPASDRALVAAAAFAREGRMLLLPPEDRELKRLLSSLSEEAKEQSAADAAFSGLERLDAEFSWKTSAIDVSRVCRRIAHLLAESGFYADRVGEDECALALEEAFVNSVEHGNLALDSSLRPDDLSMEDQFEIERERRLADPTYGDRRVHIRISVGNGQVVLVLEDEGEGFDTSKMDGSPSGLDVSGKGFWLIKRPFDEASYNRKGNILTLVRRKPGAN